LRRRDVRVPQDRLHGLVAYSQPIPICRESPSESVAGLPVSQRFLAVVFVSYLGRVFVLWSLAGRATVQNREYLPVQDIVRIHRRVDARSEDRTCCRIAASFPVCVERPFE